MFFKGSQYAFTIYQELPYIPSVLRVLNDLEKNICLFYFPKYEN